MVEGTRQDRVKVIIIMTGDQCLCARGRTIIFIHLYIAEIPEETSRVVENFRTNEEMQGTGKVGMNEFWVRRRRQLKTIPALLSAPWAIFRRDFPFYIPYNH